MAESGFVEVRGANRGNNVFPHLFAAALMVTGPIVHATDDGGTVGIVLTALLLPLGIAVWRGVARAKRRLLRLDEVGLPATAAVLTVEPISEDATVRVRLLIRGPDVPEFVIEHDTRYDPALKPGNKLAALVDPDDHRDFEPGCQGPAGRAASRTAAPPPAPTAPPDRRHSEKQCRGSPGQPTSAFGQHPDTSSGGHLRHEGDLRSPLG
ncbi:hypothetical protein [Saccharothrix sp. Mg75]|uniref:hypothetical protein n=1 Tax=Saccharothrix sp. Mg75 TaxID=3445357 RepID=UPI003EEFAED5